ncbi:MAG: tRNA uridine-5-carboxymethylaminomethyl(34) synthesis GTPase MnmE [Bacteroidaceae bacterium]|nr:tRNA uridine-5-carboxymethylaminomethyl(34) synthesis GTPase MnmE [Bacteroidaceae bacterium]
MNICALSTAIGGAIAIIRVSGPDAISIVSRHFVSARKDNSLLYAKGQSLHYGTFVSVPASAPCGSSTESIDGVGERLDDVLISVFRAPHSYTGENAVEISCHGSAFIVNSILQALIGSGCRQALPGEFTQRAYLNGKMDLSQAEAVADIIASTNAATHRIAMSQLRGNFSSELSQLRERLLHLTSLMELELDFSDHEDLEFADRTELHALATTIYDKVQQLAASFKTGQALKHGVPVAIVGKTNVGKSTLLNRLLHEDKAIVSDIHGTTRDVIEDTINLRGIDFRFIDTAGLRATDDEIERIGIERTRKKLLEAAIVLWLVDEDLTPETLATIRNEITHQKLIVVRNKMDEVPLAPHDPLVTSLSGERDVSANERNLSPGGKEESFIPISAKHGTGIKQLEDALFLAADIPEIKENDIIVTSARHYEALIRAQQSLHRVIEGMSQGIPSDLLSEDLRDTLSSLADITGGQINTDEVLSNIFKNFCIGK